MGGVALTAKQEQLWRYLLSCDRCPSFDEMCKAMGQHKSSIHRLIGALEAKGYVSRTGQCNGGYRMARSLVAHERPQIIRAPLSAYSLDELLVEVRRRTADVSEAA